MRAVLSIVLAVVAAASPSCRERTYEGQGDLLAVDAGGATIAHEKIPGLMDGMTMRFPARSPGVIAGAQPGTRVRFELIRDGDVLMLVRLEPLGLARGTSPGSHDHRPRYGGVVSMIGLVHLEVVAAPDGRIRAYLSDFWRRPLPTTDTSGTVTLVLPGGGRTLRFTSLGDALEARTTPFPVDSAIATVALVRQGQPLEANVLLDLTGNRAGVSLVPQTGCVPVTSADGDDRRPRCTVTFSSTFTALGTSPDGRDAIVAVSHGATSVWRLPEATVVMGVDPPPPIVVPHGAHEPDPRLIAVRPDGRELVVAAGSRLVFFDARTGRFERELAAPAGAVPALAWWPDGRRLVVAGAADGKARVVDASDGRVERTLPVEGRVLAVAVAPTGAMVAAGTDVGGVAFVPAAGAAPARVVTPSLQPIAAVAFAGDRLVSAGADGTVRVFDPAVARETARVNVGAPVVLLAPSPDGRWAATADAERILHVHRLPDATIVESLAWHPATLGVLGWGAGPTIVSGDNDGTLAVWDVPLAR